MFLVCTLGPAQQLPGRRGGWRRLDAPGHSHPRRFPSPHGKWNWNNDNPDESSSATLVLECFRHMTKTIFYGFWYFSWEYQNILLNTFFLNGGIRKSKIFGRSQLLVTRSRGSQDNQPETLLMNNSQTMIEISCLFASDSLISTSKKSQFCCSVGCIFKYLSSSLGWSSYFHSTQYGNEHHHQNSTFHRDFCCSRWSFPSCLLLQYPFDICLKSRAFSLHLLHMRKYPMFDITKKTSHKHLEWHSHLPELQKRQIWVLENYLNLKNCPIHSQT